MAAQSRRNALWRHFGAALALLGRQNGTLALLWGCPCACFAPDLLCRWLEGLTLLACSCLRRCFEGLTEDFAFVHAWRGTACASLLAALAPNARSARAARRSGHKRAMLSFSSWCHSGTNLFFVLVHHCFRCCHLVAVACNPGKYTSTCFCSWCAAVR